MSSLPSFPGGGMPPMVQAPVIPGHRPGMPAQAASAFTVQDVVRILKKRMIMISIIFVFFLMFTGVGTFFWAKYYPSYRAAGLIEVRSPVAPDPLTGQQQILSKDIIEQFINTQASLIRSQVTMQESINNALIKQTKWYKQFIIGGNFDINEALVDMRDRFSASPMRDTLYIQVGFQWKDPEECATVTNVILETYYQDVKSASLEKTQNELSQYRNKMDAMREELRVKKEEQERFRSSRNIPLIEQRRQNIGDQVAVLTQLLAQANADKDQAQAYFDMYNNPGAIERIGDTPQMRQLVENDPTVRYYNQLLSDLRIRLTSQKEKGSKNRTVVELDSQIKQVERELNEKRRTLVSDNYQDMKEQTRVQLDTINSQVVGLQNRLADAKSEMAELEAQLARYLGTEKEIEGLEKQMEQVGNRVLELNIQLENPDLVRVAIANRAVKPLERDMPKWTINIPAGFILGLLLGVGLAFLLEFVSTTVKSPADVLRQLHLPLLGQIPSQDDDESSASDMHRLLLESPHSMLAESFRQLRANFMFCAPSEQQKSILITSCSPSEGKTCIAVNMATSLALAGRKVLLVDANFRRPGVAQGFGIQDAREGLSNVLIGHGNPESLIKHTEHANLDILPAGPLPPNPAELLSGSYLRDFISHFSQSYETIIFDSPPVLVVSDALILSTRVDGVIMVIRAGITVRGTIMRAREQFRRANAKLLGVVLDDVKVTRGGYFKEMYKTYYEYQSPSALPKEQEEETEETAVKT